jgi:LysR family transcriptional regulator, salicylic acid-responsive activator of bsdBCD
MQRVSSGIGSTIVPESVFESYGQSGLFAKDISDSTLQSSVGLIWLKQHHLSRPAWNFIELLKQRLNISENGHE